MSMATSSAYSAAMKVGLQALESNLLPDFVIRKASRFLLSMRLSVCYKPSVEEQLSQLVAFVHSLKTMPIAVHTVDANQQHYEVPTEFYKLVLGKHLKYSSAYFPSKHTSLDEAEEAMLEIYCRRARLKDGQSVLDLGCGWGSLTLYIAEKYPNSRVTSVSNSTSQQEYIQGQCARRGLENVQVLCCDINSFDAGAKFDRILSIEMFEHMKNYQQLLRNISKWMEPDGLLFVHIFCHRLFAYHFEDSGEDDWMARNFFTGGTMPADGLLLYFQEDVSVVDHWRVNGNHYSRTSEEWLKRMNQHASAIESIFAETYGKAEVKKWVAYWRTFFIAVAELFGYNNGQEWMVSHFLFRKKEV